MPDIMISQRRQRTYLYPQTDKGIKWIIANMCYDKVGSNVFVAMDAEHTEDIIKELDEAEITYEQK